LRAIYAGPRPLLQGSRRGRRKGLGKCGGNCAPVPEQADIECPHPHFTLPRGPEFVPAPHPRFWGVEGTEGAVGVTVFMNLLWGMVAAYRLDDTMGGYIPAVI